MYHVLDKFSILISALYLCKYFYTRSLSVQQVRTRRYVDAAYERALYFLIDT